MKTMTKLTVHTLPAIAMRGLVVFPHMVFHFDVLRKKSIRALEAAAAKDGYVFLTAQKDASVEEPAKADLYALGTIVKITQFIRLPGDGARVLAEGVSRASIKKCDMDGDYITVTVSEAKSSFASLSDEEYSAISRQIHSLLELYFRAGAKASPDSLIASINESDPGALADSIAENFLNDIADKQKILETKNVKNRLLTLIDLLIREVKVLRVESDIMARVKEQMDENNREYFLREEQKAIAEELGELNGSYGEADEFEKKLEALNAPEAVKAKLSKEIDRFSRMSPHTPEYSVAMTYIETLFDIPWNKYSEENTDISASRQILERDHYGMKKVKERVLEHLAVRALTNGCPPNIICLLGPPGVGKTSVAKSLAEASGRKYVRISLGGVRDEAEILGHRRTYVGALPGRFITALIKAGTSNPLILLDEIDKMSHDYKGDPASALLEVLDSAQNNAFTDHYLEVPVDLSKVMFVTTANDISGIPAPLRDRMEIIELPSYTEEEKKEIALRHLIPKQAALHGLKKSSLRISPEIVSQMIFEYTKEAGVRSLERTIAALCRKCAVEIAEHGKKSLTITKPLLKKYLGEPKFLLEKASSEEEIGVVTGLAWTSVGGDTLTIEANVMEGTGKIELTGSLGDVMKESAMAAISYLRSKAQVLNIDPAFYKKYDIHIHVPDGATPKDGPSAGITMATALASALTGRAVRPFIAMTGEITIRGRVLPIGGLKEKVIAAYRSGIKFIIIPKENARDLNEIPESIREKISFRTVSNCDEVLSLALLAPPVKKEENVFPPSKNLSNIHKGATA